VEWGVIQWFHIGVKMACFGPSLNNPPPPLVQKDSKTSIRWSEVDLVIFLFLPFSSFHIGVHVPLKIRATSTTLLN